MRLIICMSWVALATVTAAEAKVFDVTSTADAVDSNPGNGVCATAQKTCTLRAAVQ